MIYVNSIRRFSSFQRFDLFQFDGSIQFVAKDVARATSAQRGRIRELNKWSRQIEWSQIAESNRRKEYKY